MSNRRAPRKVNSPELKRVVDDIYREISSIRHSVTKVYEGQPSPTEGKRGDIAVYKDSQSNNHVLACKTKEGWARIGLSIPKKINEPYQGLGTLSDKIKLNSSDPIELVSDKIRKPNITIKQINSPIVYPPTIKFVKTPRANDIASTAVLGTVGGIGDTSLGSDKTSGGGAFDATTNWTYSGWSIGSSKATHSTGNTSILKYTGSSGDIVASKSYTVTFTIASRTAGSITIKVGEGTASGKVSENGTYSIIVTSGSTTNVVVEVTPASTFDGSIDTLTVKRSPITDGSYEYSTITFMGNNTLSGEEDGKLLISNKKSGVAKDISIIGNDITGVGDLSLGNTLTVTGDEGEDALIYLKSDESDDASDDWSIIANQSNNTLTIGNDINSAGTQVPMLTITPHATARSSIVKTAGDLEVDGNDISYSNPSTSSFGIAPSSGTNTTGSELRINSGESTGNAAGGDINFYVSPTGSSGSSVNSATERMSISSLAITMANNLTINSNALSVIGGEGESATLYLKSDESDDNGDDWKIQANTAHRLSIGNDISGSDVTQVLITPNATVASGTTAFETIVGVNSGVLRIEELSSSPSHTANFGTLWVKDDAPSNLYYEDDAGNDFLLNNTPGTILGYTHLNPVTQTEQAATISLETIHDDAKVTFVTPQSELVKIDFQAWLEEGSSATNTILGLSTANKTDGYSTVNTRFENVANYGSRGDAMLTMSWVVSSTYLASIGSTNNIWIGFKATADESIWWGGHGTGRFPAMIITATAL